MRRPNMRLLERVHRALTAAEVWQKLHSDWVCLDCELMPWSAKAQELLRTQYAPRARRRLRRCRKRFEH